VDDNARDHAVAVARLNSAAADHASQSIVIYDLQSPPAVGQSKAPTARTDARTAAGQP